MDLPPVNLGPLHQFQIQNDAEAKIVRSVVIQKREAVERIEGEIAQLVENKTGLEDDLVRLGVALAHYNHSLLPNEVLSDIFILLALGYGTVKFEIPIPKKSTPPQLVVSHVCSRWRRVALRTPELWSDTYLFLTNKRRGGHHVRFHQRWVVRARTLPVTLSIAFGESLNHELADALRNILLPIQVKRLSLCLTFEELMALSTLPEAALLGLSEFEVELSFPDFNMNVNMNDPHPLITRLRSLTFLGPDAAVWIDRLLPCLPWSQLRSLKFQFHTKGLEDLIISILRQIPMLEALSLQIFDIGVWEQVTMPSLRNLTIELDPEVVNGTEVDNILGSFMCPSLTQFDLTVYGNWTCETFEILKQQYNMQELREAIFFGAFALPVSSFLRDAPMLRSLSLRRDAIMDEEALIGVSSGTLGRFLRRLETNIHDVGEVLDMVEARKKMVDRLIKNDCSWRDTITSLKDVVIHSTDRKDYKERIFALEEAGIRIMWEERLHAREGEGILGSKRVRTLDGN